MHDIKVVLSNFNDKCLIIDLDEESDDAENINVTDSHSIFIIENYENLRNLGNSLDFKRTFDTVEFELRFISATWEFETRRSGRIVKDWDSFVYSRHGGRSIKSGGTSVNTTSFQYR